MIHYTKEVKNDISQYEKQVNSLIEIVTKNLEIEDFYSRKNDAVEGRYFVYLICHYHYKYSNTLLSHIFKTSKRMICYGISTIKTYIEYDKKYQKDLDNILKKIGATNIDY